LTLCAGMEAVNELAKMVMLGFYDPTCFLLLRALIEKRRCARALLSAFALAAGR
jgi:hypothetical protein